MFAELPEGFTSRPPHDDDAQRVAELMNAFAAAYGDVPDDDAASVRDDWNQPGFDRERSALLVTDGAECIVGYAWVWRSREPSIFELDGYVHPNQRGRGIGAYLGRWSEARARELAADLAPEVPVTLRVGVIAQDEAAAQLFTRGGYQIARHFWRMEIHLDEPPPAPRVPEGLSIRTFVPGQDDYAAYEAVEESFADHWGHVREPFEEWARSRLHGEDFDPSLVFLAVDGEQVAGVTFARLRGGNGWVRTVGVRRPWRQRGLAMALLLSAFQVFYERGFRVVGLGVDAQNPTGATRVYERAGMSVRTRYDLYEKVVRRPDLAARPASQMTAGA